MAAPRVQLRYFERLGGLLSAPRLALRAAAEGAWSPMRDGLWLLAIATFAVFTPDVARVVMMAHDLGLPEGIQELAWAFQQRLTPDLLLLLGLAAVVAIPLRVLLRFPFERALEVATACWLPAFIVRLVSHVARHQLGYPPPGLLLGWDGWLAAAWSGSLAILALSTLRGGDHG